MKPTETSSPTAPPPQPHPYTPTLSANDIAKNISALGIKKANTESWQLLMLGALAGLYISFGGHGYLIALKEGMGRIVGGMMFSLGLVLVVIAGAELFTGNVIMFVGTITAKFRLRDLFRNWVMVYLGNFVGSYLFALCIWKAGLLGAPGALNELGVQAVKVAEAKLALPFGEVFLRGIFCNMCVVLGIILALFARDVISKIVAIMLPITFFVAAGFEHCIANMFLIPVALFAKGEPMARHYIMFGNIIPATLGNIVGGVMILILHPNRIRQLQYLLKR